MVAFVHSVENRCATRVESTSIGPALFNDELPRLYDQNFVRLETEAEFPVILQELDRAQARLKHRKLAVDQPARGSRLEPHFRERGWLVERYLYMALDEPTARVARGAHVHEVPAERLRAAWTQSSLDFGREPAVAEQITRVRDVVAAAVPTRFYAAFMDGAPISWCELYEETGIAQIEAVMTLETHRGRGHSTAVVSAAIEDALARGAELVFLVADADDWPKELYRRLGFVDGPILPRFRLEIRGKIAQEGAASSR
jgi:ribosomal protein S18 acetylase RimI-like enzyme